MTLEEKYKQIYEILYDYCNFAGSGLSRDGNRIHMYFDGEVEFDLVIDPDSIVLLDE